MAPTNNNIIIFFQAEDGIRYSHAEYHAPGWQTFRRQPAENNRGAGDVPQSAGAHRGEPNAGAGSWRDTGCVPTITGTAREWGGDLTCIERPGRSDQPQ